MWRSDVGRMVDQVGATADAVVVQVDGGDGSGPTVRT